MELSHPSKHFFEQLVTDPMKKFKDEDFYISEIERKAKNRITEKFSNSDPIHAAYVLSNIFRETNKSSPGNVFIYANNMNGEISRYEPYRIELINLLNNKNIHVTVILDDLPTKRDQETKEIAFDIIKSYSITTPNRINLYKVNNYKAVDNILLNNLELIDVHFAVSSENMYRLEIDSDLHYAECNFNDRNRSDTLINTFNEILKYTVRIE